VSAEVALPSFAELRRDLPRGSPRAWRFAALAAGSRLCAVFSDGLRTGHRHGFDSGAFMAYVYANAPSGRTALGRRLDRRLLERPTCQAFRDIRALAERAVFDALDDVPGPAPAVADLAAGPSPYLLEALARRPDARAALCDADPAALEVARRGAVARGVDRRVTLVPGDAFDRAHLGALRPRPDVVLELGLYGMYPDDALIERHFTDLAELVAPRQIVLNVQARNPEIEYIARVWRDRRGGRCVWRLRPLEQILGYAAAAGYRPAWVGADRHGIYRVARLVRAPGAG
jgi:hypothetical protein